MVKKMLKIGITFRITNAETYEEKRDSLSHDWPIFLEKIQAIPIWIPNIISNLPQFLQELDLDGIILSGGDSIGQTPIRDKTEKALINYAIEKNIPIFGVCRGMQVLNEFFGGTQKTLKNDTHVGNNHSVKIKDQSFLKLINSTNVLVNSYHRNIITTNSLAENLTPFAISDIDDTVEAFIHSDLPIIGVMWHPEREQKQFDEKIMENIFKNK
jgi:N5-(cytidine 5'-diphosphoramidyl)-L-glutamine hydrolase